MLDQVLEYVPVGIAMGRTRLSVCLRDVFVCEIWKTSCLPRIISNTMPKLQVPYLAPDAASTERGCTSTVAVEVERPVSPVS